MTSNFEVIGFLLPYIDIYRNIALIPAHRPIFMFCYFANFCYLCDTLELNKEQVLKLCL